MNMLDVKDFRVNPGIVLSGNAVECQSYGTRAERLTLNSVTRHNYKWLALRNPINHSLGTFTHTLIGNISERNKFQITMINPNIFSI